VATPHSPTRYVRSEQPLTAPVDDELVMLDTRISSYFGLDRVGRRIWELLEEPRSLDDLCAVLVTEYDIDDATCRADLTHFVESLLEKDLVVRT
jgi:hypothetical protein